MTTHSNTSNNTPPKTPLGCSTAAAQRPNPLTTSGGKRVITQAKKQKPTHAHSTQTEGQNSENENVIRMITSAEKYCIRYAVNPQETLERKRKHVITVILIKSELFVKAKHFIFCLSSEESFMIHVYL